MEADLLTRSFHRKGSRALVHFDFSGKTALVTGGGSGIGRAVALALEAANCRVIVASLGDADKPPMSRQSNSGQSNSGTITFLECDVTSESDLDRVFRDLRELDIVVHCAGIIARAEEFRPEVFARVIDVNLTSAMQVNTRAFPLLTERRGCIVHTASMLSYFGSGYAPAYSASKGGVVQLTKSLAIAWASHGIRVNAVAPGWIATGFTQALQDNPERSQQLLDRTPLKRWGTAEDLAGPILFLCSSAAEFITGTTLTVDGGYSAS